MPRLRCASGYHDRPLQGDPPPAISPLLLLISPRLIYQPYIIDTARHGIYIVSILSIAGRRQTMTLTDGGVHVEGLPVNATAVHEPQGSAMKTIVMTGGTAGIGLVAAQQMRQTPNVRLLVGTRGKAPAGIESSTLDLTRLSSVRNFAAAVSDWLGEASLDGLVLNAGVQFADAKQRTEDGFETSFAVNHLAHYLLLRLLEPRLSPGAVVVITTSNLHDPKTNPVAPPEHADPGLLARGQVRLGRKQGPRSGLRAYAATKLCNMLTARGLASSAFAQERQLRVIAFNPGFTPGTGLMRGQSTAFKFFFAVAVSILKRFRPMNTQAGGGRLLADLSLGRIAAPAGRVYASQVTRTLTWPEPSAMASDDAVIQRLWHESAIMTGVSDTP